METTTTETVRRSLITIGLVLGPALAVTSAVLGLGPEPDSMRAGFTMMAENAPRILAQDLLETLGFTLTLTALLGAAATLRHRGGVLALVGSVLGAVGIAGFGLSNGTGIAIVALAQLPAQDDAFQAAMTISSAGPLATVSTAGWLLEIAGQLGVLLILAGLWRAHVVPVWPLVLGIAGVVAVAAIGTMVATVSADVLLLATGVWVAVCLRRSYFLSLPSTSPESAAMKAS